VSNKKPTPAEAALWRRRSFEVQRSHAVASHREGPEAPSPWAGRLRTLIDASRRAEEGPSWWTPLNAYFGSVETRTDPHSYYWDGMKRIGKRDLPLVFFQFTLAGFGHFELYGRPAQRIGPGSGFFAVVPSRHRYYLPEASPGWTFVWIGIYHRYLVRRIARQVASVGPVVQAAPRSALVARLSRLVRGAFLKDFRDRFEVEAELFAFTHAFERLAQPGHDADAHELLEQLRARVLAHPQARLDVATLAAEHGMSRSAFGHFFQTRTGSTPSHFMTEVRVQAAARLLVTTRLPLARIADDCGFANANHFGKVFRRHRHQSAGAYRRSLG
jgi:AraC-like DNA-binding protein